MTKRELAAMAFVFAVLTCAVTYPQAFQLATHTGGHYDALFGMWRIAWIAHQLVSDPRHLFDGNIFDPEPNTLAYSDAALLLGVAGAPLIWAGVNLVVVYNLLVLVSFVASATAMYALARRLTAAVWPALIAGLIFAFQPYRYAHFPQIEILWTCWIPLSLLALHDVFDTRRVRSGLALGVAFSLQTLSCLYYAVFLATGLGLLLAVHVVRAARELPGLAKPMLAAAAVVAVLCIPYALPYVESRQTIGVRSEQDVAGWSPSAANYLAVAQTSVFYKQQAPHAGAIEGVLFPGAVAVALAIVGIVLAPRKYAIGYAVLICVSFDLSLGVNGFLFPLIRKVLLPYQGLRVPGRMFVMVSVGMSVMAAFAVERLQRRLRGAARHAATAAVVIIIILEGLSIPLPLNPVPSSRGATYAFLAAQPQTVVLEWPLPRPDRLGFTLDPKFMYASTSHWQRLVNGYSGYHPPSYIRLLHEIPDFPDDRSLAALRKRRVQYVVLHSGSDQEEYQRVAIALHARADVDVMWSERVVGETLTLVRLRNVAGLP